MTWLSNPEARTTPPEFEVVTGSHYTMTRADFLGGLIITDPVSGREAIQGTTRLGVMMRTLLDTPLCDGCDSPIPSDGVCHGCRMKHADIAGASLTGITEEKLPELKRTGTGGFWL